jgi:signal transduction histidine kinase
MTARLDTHQSAGGVARNLKIVDPKPECGRCGPVGTADKTTPDWPTATVTTLQAELAALQTRNRELADTVQQLWSERNRLRSPAATLRSPLPIRPPHQACGRAALAGVDERQRLERDLHDGVQNELVSLLVRLKRAEEEPDVPPGVVRTFAALGDHAMAALASVREVAYGIHPLALAKSGVIGALQARAARASIDLRVRGTVPRSSEDAEAAIYFSCSEAIQNVHKHAGSAARASLSLHQHDGVLSARIEDDGPGFDPARTPHGAGLRNIHDRVQALGGVVELDAAPGRGTVLTISLPWPTGS